MDVELRLPEACSWRRKNYRKRITCRRINHGDFVCNGNISVLGIFYNRGKFRCTRRLNQPWKSIVVKLSNHSLGISIMIKMF